MSSVGSKGRNNVSSRYRVASGENRFTVTSRLLESINRTTSFIERGSPPCVTIKRHGSSETCGVTAAAGSTFGGLYRFKNRSTQFDWAAAVVVNSAKSTTISIPLLEKEGWMRRVKRGADGVVSSAKRFGGNDHPGASRLPSFSRRGIIFFNIIPPYSYRSA